MKKEIAFSGDVLNATARLQSLCNQYQTDLLVSEPLVKKLSLEPDFQAADLGKVTLKGRQQAMEVHEVKLSSC